MLWYQVDIDIVK